MKFGQALEECKNGEKILRSGWNGKGMHVQMIGTRVMEIEPFLIIKNAQGGYNTWVPSISDLFAEDWEVLK